MTASSFNFRSYCHSAAMIGLLACQTINPLFSKTNPLPILPEVSQSLGEATLSVASTRFSIDRSDPTAHKLLRLSELLCSLKEDKVFYLKGLLRTGAKIPAQAFGPATNEKDLARHLRRFAGTKLSHFQLLLLSSSLHLDPSIKESIVAMQRAKRRGLNTDFEYLLKNIGRPVPSFGLAPPFVAEVPPQKGKALANLAAEYAARELSENRESLKGKRLIALGLLIDPENQELLYQMSLLETGKPTQRFSQTSPKEPLLKKLREISLRKENSALLNNLLHASMVAIQPDSYSSIVFLEKTKGKGVKTDFESIALEYEQFLKSRKSDPAPSSSSTPEGEIRNATLCNLLVAKTWRLTNWQTKQTWFVTFRRTSKSTFNPHGTCEGKQGNKLHTWRFWKIKDGILIIDGYARYAYDSASKAWRQANGQKDNFLR